MTQPSSQSEQRLLQALSVVHADSSSATQRLAAQRLCEQYKTESPPAQLLSAAASLLSTPASSTPLPPPLTADIVRHFGLHLLDHTLATHWPSLSAAQQADVQRYLLAFITSLCSPSTAPSNTFSDPSPSRLVAHKTAALLCQLVLRTWPQQWPDLVPTLTALAHSSPSTGAHIVCLTYGELADEVVAVGGVAEQRRREVQNAMLLSMDAVCGSMLAALQSSHTPLSLAALSALRSLADWMPGRYLFDSGLLGALVALLSRHELYTAVYEVLGVVTLKKHAAVDTAAAQLSQLLAVTLHSVDALLAAPSFPQQHAFLLATLPVLDNLARVHTSLLFAPPSPPASSSSAPPPSLTQHFLATLGSLLAHPHIKVSLPALELWVFVLRHHSSALLLPSFRASLVGELCRLAMAKVQKQPSDAKAETAATEDIDEADYLSLFSQYRGLLTSLVALLVELEPVVCLVLVRGRYEQVLSSDAPLDHANAYGYSSTRSTRFRVLESLSVMLDTSFRVLKLDAFATPPLSDIAQSLLVMLLHYHTDDPLLQTRRLQALAQFTPVYMYQPAILPPVLSTLLTSVAFRSPRERDLPWHALTEDTKACRRRAVHSLTHIARKCSARLVDGLQTVVGKVEEMAGSGQLAEDEQVLLMEFVVTVSTALPQREQQQHFLARIIAPQLQRWGDAGLQAAIAGGEGWVAVLGGGKEEVEAVRRVQADDDVSVVKKRLREAVAATNGKRMRDEIDSCLRTFASVFKSIASTTAEDKQPSTGKPSTPSPLPHPSAPLLFALLPSFLHLLSSIYSLRSPSFFPLLPPTFHSLVASSVDHLQLLRSTDNSDVDHLHSLSVHRFLDSNTDNLLALLNVATRAGDAFYEQCDAQLILQSVVAHIEHIHARDLRFLLDKFLTPLLLHCPSQSHPRVLRPLLPPLCDAVVRRLQASWFARNARQAASGTSEQVEIFEDTELREATREFADMFTRIVIQFDLHHSTATTKDSSGHLPLADCPFFSFVCGRLETATALLASLRFLLSAPDSAAQAKAARLALRLLPLALPSRQLHALLVDLMSTALLHLASVFYAPAALTTLELDLVALLTTAYIQLGKHSAAPRALLSAIDGVSAADIASLDERLAGVGAGEAGGGQQSDRKSKQAMRAFLARFVLGKLGGQQSEKVADLKQRWDRQIGPRLRESEEKGAVVEGGELHALFESKHDR